MRKPSIHRYRFKLLAAAVTMMYAMGTAACSKPAVRPAEDYSTDQMYSSFKTDETLYVFLYDNRCFTVGDMYDAGAYAAGDGKDGEFYALTADVNYLNGGVAGYVNYPEVKTVHERKQISPFDLNLPSIEERQTGLVLIGDYAEGDILLNSFDKYAVWKEGSWVFRYDKSISLEDGRNVLVHGNVSEETIKAGMENNVLSYSDYFVLPQKQS